MIEDVKNTISELRTSIINEIVLSVNDVIKIKHPSHNNVNTLNASYWLSSINKNSVVTEWYDGYKTHVREYGYEYLMLESLVHILDIVKNGEKQPKIYQIG